jgi:hypothetical protein
VTAAPDCAACGTKAGCICEAIAECAVMDACDIIEAELDKLSQEERDEVFRRLATAGYAPTSEWVIKNERGEYYDIDEREDVGEFWVERQRDACRFIERPFAVATAERTGGRVVHLVPRVSVMEICDG